MDWWMIVLLALLVVQFSFFGWLAWPDRDAYKGRPETRRGDPSRASRTSSAMQNDMQESE